MWDALVKKYGPEPPLSSAVEASAAGGAARSVTTAAPPPQTESDNRSRLARFMQKYNPEKVNSIDTILNAYAGKEQQMWEALVKKYGPEPSGGEKTLASAAAAVQWDTDKFLASVHVSFDAVLLDFPADKLFVSLAKAFGPEVEVPLQATGNGAPTTTEDTRARLSRFMQKYNPDKISSLDTILIAYQGKEDQMWAALVKKYGPEPPAVTSTSAPAASATPAAQATQPVANDDKSRLTRFMQKYNPEKLSSIDTILNAYVGKEQQMWEALIKKYGPEPIAAAVESGSPPAAPSATKSLAGDFSASSTPVEQPKEGAKDEAVAAVAAPKVPEIDPATLPVPQRLSRFLTMYRISAKQALFAIFPQELERLQYLRGKYGDYENRLRRFFVRYDPERIAEVDEMLRANSSQASSGSFDSLFVGLVEKFGAEPEKSAPAKIVTLSSRKARRRSLEDEAWTDEEPEKSSEDKAVPQGVLADARILVAESTKAPPGEYSGDEGKAYPKEEEYWFRVTVGTQSARQAAKDDDDDDNGDGGMRARTFTEFVPPSADDGAEDEEAGESGAAAPVPPTLKIPAAAAKPPSSPQSSPRSPAGSPRSVGGSPSSSAQATPRPDKSAVCVFVANKFGCGTNSLCPTCSDRVAKAFDALWQPVGPRHRQLASSTATKDGFLEKLSGGRTGNKWQRRHMRVSDKGIHYYETNSATEKPKGFKVFTKHSKVVDRVDPQRYPKCADRNFHYFFVTVNDINEEFILRAVSKEDKESWVAFLRSALERVRHTTIGQDPNPARWRARLDGVKRGTSDLIEVGDETSKLVLALQRRRDELAARLKEEQVLVDLIWTQAREMDEQAAVLRDMIEVAKGKAIDAQHEAEVRCITAAEDASKIALQRDEMEALLERTRLNIQQLTNETTQLHCNVIDQEKVKADWELKRLKLYEKWRQLEQRSPQEAARRLAAREGLQFTPPRSR